jgi:putative oxidoreductase
VNLARIAKDAAVVPLRASLGATMIHHGLQKVRGEGPDQHAQMFEGLGFRPGRRWAQLTGWSEVLAGATTILGIGTRLGAAAVLVTQGMAIAKVHAPKGFSIMSGGYEFNLALMAMATALLAAGPGRVSMHAAVSRAINGRPAGWKLALAPRRRGAAGAVAGLLQ